MKKEELQAQNDKLTIENDNFKNSRKPLLQSFFELRPEREVSFMEYLFLLFLGLKLGGAINWWYIFVFAPLMLNYFMMFVHIVRERNLIIRMKKEIVKRKEAEADEALERTKEFIKD